MADPLSGAAGGAAAGSMFGPIGTGVGALVGGIGGMLGGGAGERRGYERAVKQRKHGLSLFGIGDWSAIHRAQQLKGASGNTALTAEDFAALGIDPSQSSYADMVIRGGIHGIRKDYQQKFLENLQGGFAGAEEALKGSAEQARGGVLGERQSGIADVQQSLQSAGLQSSNIAQQARANVSYQTGRALSEIDTALGASLSQLNVQKAQTMDAALARNLGLDEQTMSELMGFLVGPSGYGPYASSQYFGVGAGMGYQSQPIDYGSVGAGAAEIFNMLFPGK